MSEGSDRQHLYLTTFWYRRIDGRWKRVAELFPPEPEDQSNFGPALVIGSTLFFGRPRYSNPSKYCGLVHVYSLPDLMAQRGGNVDARSGFTTDVLFVNDTAERRVNLRRDEPLTIRIATPPSMPIGARFAVYVWRRAPNVATCDDLPYGIGSISLPTPLSRRYPRPNRIANTMGDPLYGVENWPSVPTPAPSVLAHLPDGIGLQREGPF
ncbi:MAG: hypothetical protein HYR85_15745 [Planctomycetes bacterium]|nr:hypothetical protein [Planctomycetota bacterium]